MPNQPRILVVAAHPDDEVLGCGATIAKYAGCGAAVAVIIMTDGGLARYDADKRAQLKTHAQAAARTMGVAELHFADLPDQQLDTTPLTEIARPLEALCDAFEPSTVYTHFEGDVNTDHERVLRATMVAVRPMRRPGITRVLSYPVLSSTEQGPLDLRQPFVPNVFEAVDDWLACKIEALACYTSEMHRYPHPRSAEAIEAQARLYGMHAGVGMAEGFALRRETRPA